MTDSSLKASMSSWAKVILIPAFIGVCTLVSVYVATSIKLAGLERTQMQHSTEIISLKDQIAVDQSEIHTLKATLIKTIEEVHTNTRDLGNNAKAISSLEAEVKTIAQHTASSNQILRTVEGSLRELSKNNKELTKIVIRMEERDKLKQTR